MVDAGTYLTDLDIGEMFLNYPMHEAERKSFGMRLTLTREGEETETVRRFTRLFFGCRCSPYAAVQGCTRAQELIKGDHRDPRNPYQWDHVRLNLPMDKAYNPSLPSHIE